MSLQIAVPTAAATTTGRSTRPANGTHVETRSGDATSQVDGFSAERLRKFDAYWQDLVERRQIAGIVTLVARHGKIVHTGLIGYQDVAAGTPMQADTLFRIYSMSKVFTATAMMMLYEEGKWQFGDSVADYVPQFANLKVSNGVDANGQMLLVDPVHPMTVRELLTHTAGFSYDYFNQTPVERRYADVNVLDKSQTLQVFIDKLAQIPLNTQPGAVWHYSYSADVQGYMVERLSGRSLDRFFRERIVRPLQLHDTGFSVAPAKAGRLASLYTYGAPNGNTGALVKIDAPDHDYTSPAVCYSGGDGLVSSAPDLMRLLQMLLNGGELDGVRFLAPRTVELMRSNLLPDNIHETEPGRGWATGFAVLTDPARAGTPQGKGTFYWNGAAGTAFWVDPVNDVIVIGMLQQWSTPQAPDFLGSAPPLVYQALVRP